MRRRKVEWINPVLRGTSPLSSAGPPQSFKGSLYQSALRSVPQAQSRMDRLYYSADPPTPKKPFEPLRRREALRNASRFPTLAVTLCLHLHYSADLSNPKLCGGERFRATCSLHRAPRGAMLYIVSRYVLCGEMIPVSPQTFVPADS